MLTVIVLSFPLDGVEQNFGLSNVCVNSRWFQLVRGLWIRLDPSQNVCCIGKVVFQFVFYLLFC